MRFTDPFDGYHNVTMIAVNLRSPILHRYLRSHVPASQPLSLSASLQLPSPIIKLDVIGCQSEPWNHQLNHFSSLLSYNNTAPFQDFGHFSCLASMSVFSTHAATHGRQCCQSFHLLRSRANLIIATSTPCIESHSLGVCGTFQSTKQAI
jgi:hypothetical protein